MSKPLAKWHQLEKEIGRSHLHASKKFVLQAHVSLERYFCRADINGIGAGFEL
jgi:hypothetical protein